MTSKDERKTQILDAAVRVFSRKGYHLTDVQEIADALKIGKGTIYRYFPTKKKLFGAVMQREINRHFEAVHNKFEDEKNPVKFLEKAIRTHMEFFSKDMDLIELYMHSRSEFKEDFSKYEKIHMGKSEEIIRKCMAMGLMKKADPKAVVSVLTDLFYGMLFTACLEKRTNFRQKGENIINIFIKNLMK